MQTFFDDQDLTAEQLNAAFAEVGGGGGGGTDSVPAFVVPPQVYGVVGQEFDIYWDNLQSGDFKDYAWTALPSSPIGGMQMLSDCLRWPVSVPGGPIGITVNLQKKTDLVVLAAGTFGATFSAAAAASGINRKQLWIGDSIVGVGYHLQRMQDLAATPGEVMGATMIGSRNVQSTYRMPVSGIVVPPVSGGSIYQTNGTFYLCVQQRLDNKGNGYLFFQYWLGSGTAAPTAAGGTLTNVAGPGDATITYGATTRQSPLVHHEGRGGWRTDDFATVGRTFYLFTVGGITALPTGFTDVNQTNFTNNGSTFAVRDTSLSGSPGSIAGTLLCERVVGTNAPTSAGTLTKVSGGLGDATVAFSAVSTQSGNPFWNPGTSQLDLAYYLTKYGLTLGSNDWIHICLGYNDWIYLQSDAAVLAQIPTSLAHIDALRTMVKAYNTANSVNIKIGIIGEPMLCGSQDGFDIFSAGPLGTGSSILRYQVKRNNILYLQALIAHVAAYADANTTFVSMFHTGDCFNGYRVADPAPIASDIPEITVQRQSDIHPFIPAGWQHGDAVWAFMKNAA